MMTEELIKTYLNSLRLDFNLFKDSIKEVSDEMMQWKTEGTKLYQQLPADMFATFKECEPLRDVQLQKSTKSSNPYITWNERKRSDK